MCAALAYLGCQGLASIAPVAHRGNDQTMPRTVAVRTSQERTPPKASAFREDSSPVQANHGPLKQSESGDQWAVLAGIRFVLALVVMLHHLSPQQLVTDPLHYADFGGLSAVLGFFVISGYSMANSLTLDGDAKRFFERRFWRIYPAYLFALVLAMVPSILFGTIFSNAQPGFGAEPDKREFLLACAFMQGLVTPGDVPANGVLWSLSVEVWLYALSPWLFKTSLKWLKILAVASIAIYLFHDRIDATPLYANDHGLAFLSTAWAFVAGFAYYRFREKFGQTLPLVLIGVFLSCYLDSRFGPITFALAITGVALSSKITLNPKSRTVLVSAGNLSYPLYLVHVPVIDMAVGFGYTNGIATVFVALLLASCVRLCIEMPIEWYRRRRHLSSVAVSRDEHHPPTK
jgi:peptidoglycan/LPS O-acetylase OafA/YrhL